MKLEEALVQKAMNGDEYAMNRLLNQSYSPAYRFALKYFGDHDTAIEVTQRCFIKVSEHIQHLEDPKTYKSWLFRILTNQCHEEKRRAKSKGFMHWLSFSNKRVSTIEHAGLHNHLADSENEADHLLVESERQKILQQALEQLGQEAKTVLILKHYENLKFREIADILGISENTVKSRLYSALNKLQTYFESNPQLKMELWHE